MRPAAIGHHGETVAQLLRPGFHSGTVPKLFAKARRARRRDARREDDRATERLKWQFHEVEEAVAHFTERELLSYLTYLCSIYWLSRMDMSRMVEITESVMVNAES